jgi:hypothetical protein
MSPDPNVVAQMGTNGNLERLNLFLTLFFGAVSIVGSVLSLLSWSAAKRASKAAQAAEMEAARAVRDVSQRVTIADTSRIRIGIQAALQALETKQYPSSLAQFRAGHERLAELAPRLPQDAHARVLELMEALTSVEQALSRAVTDGTIPDINTAGLAASLNPFLDSLAAVGVRLQYPEETANT